MMGSKLLTKYSNYYHCHCDTELIALSVVITMTNINTLYPPSIRNMCFQVLFYLILLTNLGKRYSITIPIL